MSDKVPDAKTIWLFREKLTRAGVIDTLFARFDKVLREAGYIAMCGQLVDASLFAAPKQRNTEDERNALKQGRVPGAWRKNKAKLRQKDTHARWTVQFGKARERKDGSKHLDIAIPHFSYKAHTSIDKGYRFIRKWLVTDAASYDGRQLRRGLLDRANTGSQVWADSAYRSRQNEAFMQANGFVSQLHRRKPKGKPMPANVRRGNKCFS